MHNVLADDTIPTANPTSYALANKNEIERFFPIHDVQEIFLRKSTRENEQH